MAEMMGLNDLGVAVFQRMDFAKARFSGLWISRDMGFSISENGKEGFGFGQM